MRHLHSITSKKTNMEKNLHPEQSLKIIEEMLQKTRDNFKERDAFHFLFWGWAVVICCLTQYYLAFHVQTELNYLPWVIVMPLGGILVGIRESRSKSEETARTFTDRVIAIVWMIGGLQFFAVVFAAVYQGMSPNPFVLLVAGTLTMISGSLWRFKLMMAGGIIMFASGIGSLFVPDDVQLLIMAGAIVIGYLIPGYQMRKGE